MNGFPAEDKKKLNQNNAKAFNTLKHHLKKNNKNYEEQINAFTKNPTETTSEEEEEKLDDKEESDEGEEI